MRNETVVGFDADHATICKFPSRQGSSYSTVLRRLRAEIAAIGTPEADQEHEARVQKLLESVS
jgi:hypothetical protein